MPVALLLPQLVTAVAVGAAGEDTEPKTHDKRRSQGQSLPKMTTFPPKSRRERVKTVSLTHAEKSSIMR